MRVLFILLMILCSKVCATSTALDTHNPHIKYLISRIIGYSHQETFLKDLDTINYKHHKLTDRSIEALEQRWQQEQHKRHQPLRSSILENSLSEYLKLIEKNSKGLFSDITVLDKKGLVVGMTTQSYNYQRFFEEKFHTPWTMGPNGVYISPYLFSPTAGKSLIYICVTITNRLHESLGVIVVGVDKELIEATVNKQLHS